jgi:hypothetical protein
VLWVFCSDLVCDSHGEIVSLGKGILVPNPYQLAGLTGRSVHWSQRPDVLPADIQLLKSFLQDIVTCWQENAAEIVVVLAVGFMGYLRKRLLGIHSGIRLPLYVIHGPPQAGAL